MEKRWEVRHCENRAKEGHPACSATDYGFSNYIDKLSDEILVEILSRVLSWEIAIQCKCVSKRWLNLISCPSFTWEFLFHQHNRSSRKPLPFALICSYSDPEEQVRILVYSKDHPTEFGSHGFTFEFLPNYRTKQGEQIPIKSYIKAGCGDLLVFRCIRKGNRDENWRELELEENYIICNPRTMQWVWLPPVPCRIGCSTEVALVCDPFYSFDTHHNRCCLQDSYRYRVFSISMVERGLERPKLNVFDSETRQWGKLVLSGPQGGLRFIVGVAPVASNGMLHFLNISNIVAFDAFASEMGSVVACRFINLPAQLGHWRLAYLGSCAGHLRLSLGEGRGSSQLMRVWDLEDYDKGEWCLKHQFSFKNLKAFCNSRLNKKDRMHAIFSLRVLGFHPHDKDILYLRFPDCIAEYDMRTHTWESGCEFPLGVSVKNNTEGYLVGGVHRVLLPWWPTPVPVLE